MSVNDGMTAFTARPLDVATWPAFARLVEADNGVWGGCWCMGFHVPVGKGRTPQQNRDEKERRVRDGTIHAALVFDGDTCLPDWRITCFFTGKGNRKRAVANVALGALAEIARAAADSSRATPRRPTTAPCPARSCTPDRWPQLRTTASPAPGRSRRWVVTRTVDPT